MLEPSVDENPWMVPISSSDADQQMKACFERIQKHRAKIGVLQRFSIISQIYPQMHDKKPEYDFIPLLEHDPDVSSDSILPQHVQFISKLYEFISYSPHDLTKITINAANTFSHDEFLIFAWSVIPSLFGFFTFAEHCYLAYQFFTVISTTATKDIARKIIAPFFRSSSTYLFHESIFKDMRSFFCNDARTARNFVKYEQEYAQYFLNSFTTHLNKIPISHFNLIRFMRKINWSAKELVQFLIQDCCIPMIETLLKASPFSHTLSMFESFIKLVPDHFIQEIDSIIFRVQSVFEIPSGFSGFNHSYIEFLASPNDATLLIRAANNVIKMPKLISMIMTPRYAECTITLPIWFKIFPKRLFQVDSKKLRNVIFPSDKLVKQEIPNIAIFDRWWRKLESDAADVNTSVLNLLYKDPFKNYLKEEVSGVNFENYVKVHELNSMKNRAERFETFLALQLSLKSVKKYGQQVKDFSNCEIFMISRKMFTTLFQNHKKPKTLITYNFDAYSRLFHASYQSAQFAFALKYQYYLDTISKKYKQRVASIEKMWVKMLESVEYNMLPKCLCVTPRSKALVINKAYIMASSTLNVIGHIEFSMQFFVIIECLKQLEIVSGFDDHNFVELVIHAIKSCIAPNIIIALLFLSGVLLNRKDFLSVTPKEELTLWYTLMEGLHNFIGGNSELEKAFYQLHDDVNMVFSDL